MVKSPSPLQGLAFQSQVQNMSDFWIFFKSKNPIHTTMRRVHLSFLSELLLARSRGYLSGSHTATLPNAHIGHEINFCRGFVIHVANNSQSWPPAGEHKRQSFSFHFPPPPPKDEGRKLIPVNSSHCAKPEEERRFRRRRSAPEYKIHGRSPPSGPGERQRQTEKWPSLALRSALCQPARLTSPASGRAPY